MKPGVNILRFFILLIGIIVLAFDAELYNLCKQQRNEINTMSDQQKMAIQVDSNKFKDQQQEIIHLRVDLEDANRQIKDQNDALVDEKDENKNIQTSLIDLKAEADAIKQDMKGWQKDYVTVLAELGRKMDDSQDQIKNLSDNIDSLKIPELKQSIVSLQAAIDKIMHPPDNDLDHMLPALENKVERTDSDSQ